MSAAVRAADGRAGALVAESKRHEGMADPPEPDEEGQRLTR
ncbi:MAG: hypothetical protein OXT63_04985 [Gemmatimonadota bacterium]|nr:hypothetical protein [Gemmatimonadota bacterium]